MRLADGLTEEQVAAACRDHTERLREWIATFSGGDRPLTVYDGTITSLSRLFQEHPDSSFREVKANTRKSYGDSLKVIEATVGSRVVPGITVLDIKRWFRNWGAPAEEGKPPRPKRAHDAVSMLRQLLRFGHALGYDECGTLAERLKNLRFQRPGAREEEMGLGQAVAFIAKALELGERDMAIGVAAQFELMLRQKDIIGEWGPANPEAAGAVHHGDETWTGAFRWENLPGWRLRLRTSKTKARTVFDLQSYPLLFPLLESVPHDERVGAIVKGEHGLPVRERSYRKWYRQIARAAGIPDSVWSMDSRAGGATEAFEAGADIRAIAAHLTHSNLSTTPRYIRKTEKQTAEVARLRASSRPVEGPKD
ncbi:tyrosine-type recombinase/integrase [Ancylobacter sp. FA202]|uniref:tyrosine-type recombinase/integrase n=1 Tax=Ancylobacter sp. FA202 TaxID=1111106 RepID=UPI00036B9E29|nr:tyrosine-type recombinase/integrase [Ancylobacter sp. FA202]